MRRLLVVLAAALMLVMAAVVVQAPAQVEQPEPTAQATPPTEAAPAFWKKRGCEHMHRSTVAKRRITRLLRHYATLRRGASKDVRHYTLCVSTAPKSKRLRGHAAQQYRWRKLNVCAGSNVAIGRCMARRDMGWTGSQWSCLYSLWSHESGWVHTKWNYAGSGAYGIPQALPASKMASHGSDYMSNPATQIAWGLDYIAGRYGTPCGAYAFWQANNSY